MSVIKYNIIFIKITMVWTLTKKQIYSSIANSIELIIKFLSMYFVNLNRDNMNTYSGGRSLGAPLDFLFFVLL